MRNRIGCNILHLKSIKHVCICVHNSQYRSKVWSRYSNVLGTGGVYLKCVQVREIDWWIDAYINTNIYTDYLMYSSQLPDNVPCDLLRCWQPPALQHLQCPWLYLFQVIHYEKVILLLPIKSKQTANWPMNTFKHLLINGLRKGIWLNKLKQLLTCLYSSSVMVPSLSVSCILNRTTKKRHLTVLLLHVSVNWPVYLHASQQ